MSKIVKNINAFSGLDTMEDELETYTHDDSLKDFEEDYWTKVGELEDGGWKKYEVLPRFLKRNCDYF